MIRFCFATTYQLGRSSHAGSPDGVTSAATAPGRCVAARKPCLVARQILRESLREPGWVDVGVHVPGLGAGGGLGDEVVGHLRVTKDNDR